jgi:hypothetical protein
MACIIYLLCATELVREDCGGGKDYSQYQSWQLWISGLVLYISSVLQSWYQRIVEGVQTTRCTSHGSGGLRACIIYLFFATALVREDCGGGTDYSLYQSWQRQNSVVVFIHLFCATELVRGLWRVLRTILYISPGRGRSLCL